MASVFLAVQASLGRPVALKVLAPCLAAQRSFTRRFLNEGKIIAYLKHPQIVNIYDLGAYHHDYYLTMEFLPAGTLEQRITRGISPARSVQIVKQIATALGFAHRQGVIHRDIKPQNILFRDDDLPVLTDFGIARLVDGGPHLTIPGRTMGSPLYMSPEQINGRKIDARADLYALGILFYEMLTGKLPYASDQFVTIALMHKTAPIPILPHDLSMFQPVLNKLLAKNPDHRFASAQDLIDALIWIESKYPLPVRAPDRRDSVSQPPLDVSAAGKIGLLNLDQTDSIDDCSFHALEPTRAADPARQSAPKQDQAGLRLDQPIQAVNSEASAASKGRTARKKGALIGAAAMGIALAVAFYWMAPVAGLQQPVTHPVPVTPKDDSLQPIRDLEMSNAQQPEQVQLKQRQGDLAEMSATPEDDRPAVDQKVADLLAKAQEQLARYRLTAPAGDNSYETYQQIVALDPSSQTAESIPIRIGEAYRQLALGAKAKGRLQQGLIYVANGLKIRREDSTLLTLQSELRAGMAEQTRIKIEQARRIEKQERERAAEQAAIAEERKAGQDLAERQRQEAESRRHEAVRTLAERQRAEQEIGKQQKVKIEIDQPEAAGKESDHKIRLFGTF